MTRIEGVDSVGVSLDSGLAVIRLKPENRVTLEQVREAIRRNGFTPKAAEVEVRGTLGARGASLLLALPAGDRVFELITSGAPGEVLGRLRSVRPGTVLVVEGVV
ncbi:MAG TPA: heavy-metal-associated domain-containing protein, partial [Gemmatimonadales bacterium]|nr:heavy-metal-associated domain-containing protein [Gemmatimonadales bacterium]